jgi:hypothetical protein
VRYVNSIKMRPYTRSADKAQSPLQATSSRCALSIRWRRFVGQWGEWWRNVSAIFLRGERECCRRRR